MFAAAAIATAVGRETDEENHEGAEGRWDYGLSGAGAEILCPATRSST